MQHSMWWLVAFVAHWASCVSAQTVSSGCASASCRKILCLHGGGQTGPQFRNYDMAHVISTAGAGYEFVFLTAPYSRRALWIRDPPGSKSNPTTDPSWDQSSISALDAVVAAQGPFYGLLGYSQGTAMAIAYLAHAPANTFDVLLVFCAYIPSTHHGITNRINNAAPFALPSLIFMGQTDYVITNSMTNAYASKFVNPTRSTSSIAGHHIPATSDPRYNDIFNFLNANQGSSASRAPTASPSSALPTDSPTYSPSGPPIPTNAPTASPSSSPTNAPTGTPSVSPTAAPSGTPSVAPTSRPSIAPTPRPTVLHHPISIASITDPIQYTEIIKLAHEMAYADTLDLLSNDKTSYLIGASVSSATGRRSTITVTFTTTVEGGSSAIAPTVESATELVTGTTFAASIDAVKAANDNFASVTTPSASSFTVGTATSVIQSSADSSDDDEDNTLPLLVIGGACGALLVLCAFGLVVWWWCRTSSLVQVRPLRNKYAAQPVLGCDDGPAPLCNLQTDDKVASKTSKSLIKQKLPQQKLPQLSLKKQKLRHNCISRTSHGP